MPDLIHYSYEGRKQVTLTVINATFEKILQDSVYTYKKQIIRQQGVNFELFD